MTTENNDFSAGYDKASMQFLVGKVEAMDSKLDNISKQVGDINTSLTLTNSKLLVIDEKKIPDLEQRIRELEKTAWKNAGIAAGISLVITLGPVLLSWIAKLGN